MPINELSISSAVEGLIDGEYFDDEVMDDVVLTLDGDQEFLGLTREEIEEIALEGANIVFSQLIGALVQMQRTLREADEVAGLLERFDAEDYDWEL